MPKNVTRPGDPGWRWAESMGIGFWILPAPSMLPPGTILEMPCPDCHGEGRTFRLWFRLWCKRCRGTGVARYGPVPHR